MSEAAEKLEASDVYGMTMRDFLDEQLPRDARWNIDTKNLASGAHASINPKGRYKLWAVGQDFVSFEDLGRDKGLLVIPLERVSFSLGAPRKISIGVVIV